jgi:uncharacterized damage-inducible protein DinB
MSSITQMLSTDLQGGYAGPNWIDISLKQTIDNISAENAFWQPPGEVHSIASITCHLITWRKALIEVLENKQDWKVTQEASFYTTAFGKSDAQRWINIKNVLEDTQQQLLLLLNDAEPLLEKTVPDRTYSYRYFIQGTIQHDAYHLGQIVLLAKQAETSL